MKKKAFNTWKSWVIAVVCSVVYGLIVIVYRLSALFYVELIELYHVDRKTASIPFVVLQFVRCLSGFIFGMLGEQYGLQRIIYLGCCLSVLGVGASYFTYNIITLSVTLGLIYGFGLTATALLPTILREHFDDSATAISNGFLNVGPCLTAIVFPGLIMYFIEEYGVSGAFLLTSGVILNAVPLIMFLKPRNLSKYHETTIDIESSEPLKSQDINLRGLEDLDVPLNNEENINKSKDTNSQELKTMCKKDDSIEERNRDKKKSFFYTLNVFKDPTFFAISLIQGLFAYTFNIWLTTMIDYSRDKGIDTSYEIYILTLNPITDVVGRLSLAWVTDKGFLSVPNFCALLYILLALSSICIALARDFAIMTLGILVMTFAIGAFASIYPRMSYSFIEKDKQAVSIASLGLLYAPLSFTVAPLIGYFRGSLGSYDGLYYMLAVMNFTCSIIVLLLPKLANRRERRKLKKSQNTTSFEIS